MAGEENEVEISCIPRIRRGACRSKKNGAGDGQQPGVGPRFVDRDLRRPNGRIVPVYLISGYLMPLDSWPLVVVGAATTIGRHCP